MLQKHMLLSGAITGSLLFLAYPAAAQSNQQLQDEIRQLQQQLQNLQNKVDQQPTAPAAAAPAGVPVAGGPRVTLSPNNRPGFASADGQNTIELTSRVHFDIGDYLKVQPQSPAGPHSLTSGVDARRARIGVLGKFMGDWNYTFITEFGGSTDGPQTSNIENAYLSYNGFRPVAIDFGYLDVPFTLDEATSSNDIMFMERAEIQNVVTNMAANDGRAALGVRSNNDRYWAGAYLTGPVAGALHTGSNQQQLGATARATYQVLQSNNYYLHLGVDGEYVFTPRANGNSAASNASTLSFSDRPELRVDPTTFLNTGAIPAKNAGAFGPEIAGGLGSAFFQAEYYHIFIDQSGQSATAPTPRLNFDGYYVQASYVLTGESRKYIPTTGAYSGVRPNRPVGSGGWGAWEVAVRWAHVDLNSHDTPGVAQTTSGGVFGGRANGLAFGVNWYVNNNIRFMLNYIHDDVDKLAANGVTGAGARIDAIAARTQIAF
jgi:phosphate-selective porin OprO and OprP